MRKLRIELVPRPLWCKSLRCLLPGEIWDKIWVKYYGKHGGKCEVCGWPKRPLHLHEEWKYDDKKHIQKLSRLRFLCEKCHWTVHLGQGQIEVGGTELNYNDIVKHFCKVNRCSKRDFNRCSNEARRIWEKRSEYEWKQDFGKYRRLYKRYIKKGRAKKRETKAHK